MRTAREPVSFIVPAYNCADTIRQTVDSIFHGNFDPHDEIILIDDASTDETPSMLRKIQEERPSVRLLRHSWNRGTAAASRNTGIEAASNDLVFCLDADNVLAAESIGPLAEHLSASGADAAAFGELHYFRGSPKRVTHKWIYRERVSLSDALAGVIWPGPSGNYMFTRESWIRAGRYHEPSLENRSLDSWTFGIRQLGTGSKLVCMPGTWYFHRYGHRSHYVQNWRQGSQSLAGLIGLLPLLELLEPEDVEYIFSRESRTRWYESLAAHPLRVKGAAPGLDGTIEYLPRYRQEQRREKLASVARKVRSRLTR
jgi:glycosyltransferase involved in cell wall biosynthesis